MEFFRRQRVAAELACRLLEPGMLDEGLRSGLFLAGTRRTGKTTFLRNDLIPELKARGAVVVYVDLWSDTRASPLHLLKTAVSQSLSDLSNPLRRRTQQQKPEEDETTLAEDITLLVQQSRHDVVLIVDEVLQAIQSDEGNHMLLAIKAARDAINTDTSTPGHFLMVGTYSQHALQNDLTTRHDQAFAGATVLPYPLLDEDYVAHVLERLAAEGVAPLPSQQAGWTAFQALQCRPEEFLRALRQLRTSGKADQDPDQQLLTIVTMLRGATADIELLKVEQIGDVGRIIFDWIASHEGATNRLLSGDLTSIISTKVGRHITAEEIQSVVNELISANLIRRVGHGDYVICDPMALAIWQKRQN